VNGLLFYGINRFVFSDREPDMTKQFKPTSKDSPLLGTMFLRRVKQRIGRMIVPRLPVSRHAFDDFRWEARAFWVRANNKLNPIYIYKCARIAAQDNLSVNIACGDTAIEGWVNLDLMSHKLVSLRYDCRRPLFLRDETVLRIRCEHFLEHLDYRLEAPDFLKSCYRCLKKNGVLRIVVPDTERFLRAYQSCEKNAWGALNWDLNDLPEGFYTAMDIINHIFRQSGEHMYAYDFQTLSLLLKRAGFSNIRKTEFHLSCDPHLTRDSWPNSPHSLYVEAVK